MKRAVLALALLAGFAAAQDDPWRDQAEKTRRAVAAAEKAAEGDSYEDSSYGSSSSDALGKEHAKAVLKKQRQRLAAIEKGRALKIPKTRFDYARYATHIRGKADLMYNGAWTPLQEGFPLNVGDRIRVGDGALVSLWIGGGFLTLDENSEAMVSEEKTVLLTRGRMHWENLSKEGRELQCRTPSVLATIKGTEFDMRLRGTESVFVPFSGVVELRSLATSLARIPSALRGGGGAGAASSSKQGRAPSSFSVTSSAGEPAKAEPLSQAQAASSRVDSVEGSVSIRRGAKTSRAVAGARLAVGDFVTTGAASRTRLALEGGFLVELSANTSFQVEKRSYSLLEGLAHIWTSVARAAGEEDWNFRTPNAVAAVRGTSFKLAYSKSTGRDEFTPESGLLEVTAKRDSKLKDLESWWNKD